MNPSEEQLPVEHDENATELLFEEPTTTIVAKHGSTSRAFAGVICGIIAGVLIPGALANGCRFYFPEEMQAGTAWTFLWGEHWAIRVVASWASAAGAGFITGIIARRKGRLLAGIAALPSTLCWLVIALIGWTQKVPFLENQFEVDISIGNKLAASLLVLTIIPFACYGGLAGEEAGKMFGEHFDSRNYTLLGIKWYHYLWLPIVIQLLLVQTAWACLYAFEWFRNTWRAGMSLLSIVPSLFAVAILWTISITVDGVFRAYKILSGVEKVPLGRSRAFQVLKYGLGLPLLAAALQAGISLLHYGLAKLLTGASQ